MKPFPVILCIVAAVVGGLGARAAVNGLRDGEPSPKDLVAFHADGYTVKLPGEPERGELSIPTEDGDLKAVYHYAEHGPTIMGVAMMDAPRGDKPDLKGAILGTALMTGGTIADEATTRHRRLRARDARISGVRVDDGKTVGTLFVRVIARGRRMYQLQYIVADANRTTAPAVYDAFVKSFKARTGA